MTPKTFDKLEREIVVSENQMEIIDRYFPKGDKRRGVVLVVNACALAEGFAQGKNMTLKEIEEEIDAHQTGWWAGTNYFSKGKIDLQLEKFATNLIKTFCESLKSALKEKNE